MSRFLEGRQKLVVNVAFCDATGEMVEVRKPEKKAKTERVEQDLVCRCARNTFPSSRRHHSTGGPSILSALAGARNERDV